MKKEAYANSPTDAAAKRLNTYRETVYLTYRNRKSLHRKKSCSSAFKESLIEAYELFCRANGMSGRSHIMMV
jgi:hypothetical protein